MYCTAMLINIYCAGIIQLYPCSFIAKYHYQSSCYLKKLMSAFFFAKNHLSSMYNVQIYF